MREKKKIEKVVGMDKIKRINHFGSTAVEGLMAKPIVDIMLEVDRNINIEDLNTCFKNAELLLMAIVYKILWYRI